MVQMSPCDDARGTSYSRKAERSPCDDARGTSYPYSFIFAVVVIDGSILGMELVYELLEGAFDVCRRVLLV